jgi:pseudouridine-5'-phosphate glycosidase
MDQLTVACSDEVATARRQGRPVVALESSLITHGLPWPVNRDAARRAEAAVREAGAVPATVALIAGEVRIGLLATEVDELARAGEALVKASRRDLGPALVQKRTAGTTVSATVFLARRAGLNVVATGGLGGVHRGAGHTFDISTDLDELARADGLVLVCSGAKSILDLPATLEALETRGITVLGYRTGHLPAFTVRTSGLPLDWRVETAAEAAAVVVEQHRLGTPGAVILAQEVAEEVAVPAGEMDAALQQALAAAEAAGVRGKAVTPFLLEAVREATGGRSLVANQALIEANAALAGQVAVALQRTAGPGRPGSISSTLC